MPYLVSNPTSALMYLGSQEALQRVSSSLARMEVEAGPNPTRDLITLHQHGHSFGNLPWLFWISLGLLITLFHLFFCKIIYDELRHNREEDDRLNRSYLLPYHYNDDYSGGGGGRSTDLRSKHAVHAREFIKAELASRRRYTDNIP